MMSTSLHDDLLVVKIVVRVQMTAFMACITHTMQPHMSQAVGWAVLSTFDVDCIVSSRSYHSGCPTLSA